jgi:mono/diheme cytochrome c family protein
MFERVREFIRKPDVIAGYMYANGIRHADYALLQSQGLLAQATYVPTRVVTDDNRVELGESVFTLACSRCHTTTGVNGIVARVGNLFPDQPWQHDKVKANLGGLDRLPYMPPFPGTDDELGLLTDYILSLQTNPRSLPGAQDAGVSTPAEDEPLPTALSAMK